MALIDGKIRENKSLYWGGILQLFYGLIELIDIIAIVLMTIGLFPPISMVLFPVRTEIGIFMDIMPIIFIPIFFFFASLRIWSGYWILLNRAKGFWMAIFVTGVSLVAAWFFLPLSALDLCILLPLLILLFQGYYQDSPIISE
jgi:hypothetical protein